MLADRAGLVRAEQRQQESRNRIAATSNAAIAPSAQLPSSVARDRERRRSARARNTRKRGGAILLPMVRGFAMARSVIARLRVVQ